MTKVVSFIGTESRMVVASGWEGGNGELVFNGHRVSILQDGKVLKVGGGEAAWKYKCAYCYRTVCVKYLPC